MESRQKPASISDAIAALKKLDGFIPVQQRRALGDLMRGEERQFFFDKLVEMANIVETMPKTYEQDGKGDEAIVYLHYFSASQDWYITEKDSEAEQHQAYGLADIGFGGEQGYISLVELTQMRGFPFVELDLHFTPRTLRELKTQRAQRKRSTRNDPDSEEGGQNGRN